MLWFPILESPIGVKGLHSPLPSGYHLTHNTIGDWMWWIRASPGQPQLAELTLKLPSANRNPGESGGAITAWPFLGTNPQNPSPSPSTSRSEWSPAALTRSYHCMLHSKTYSMSQVKQQSRVMKTGYTEKWAELEGTVKMGQHIREPPHIGWNGNTEVFKEGRQGKEFNLSVIIPHVWSQ